MRINILKSSLKGQNDMKPLIQFLVQFYLSFYYQNKKYRKQITKAVHLKMDDFN